jgi:hypothetical protein
MVHLLPSSNVDHEFPRFAYGHALYTPIVRIVMVVRYSLNEI